VGKLPRCSWWLCKAGQGRRLRCVQDDRKYDSSAPVVK